jgi:hypothetical protein
VIKKLVLKAFRNYAFSGMPRHLGYLTWLLNFRCSWPVGLPTDLIEARHDAPWDCTKLPDA